MKLGAQISNRRTLQNVASASSIAGKVSTTSLPATNQHKQVAAFLGCNTALPFLMPFALLPSWSHIFATAIGCLHHRTDCFDLLHNLPPSLSLSFSMCVCAPGLLNKVTTYTFYTCIVIMI